MKINASSRLVMSNLPVAGNTEGWLGVDLDGTLAFYDEWRGEEHIGAPIPAMVKRVKIWLTEGKDVRILTARVSGGKWRHPDHPAVKAIRAWCVTHIGQVLPITSEKDPMMKQLWDDRAVQVIENTGEPVVLEATTRLRASANDDANIETQQRQLTALKERLNQAEDDKDKELLQRRINRIQEQIQRIKDRKSAGK